MSTNSTIAMENSDGTVTIIYCHWDGHLDTNGKTLLENYDSKEQVSELLELGDLSVLERTPLACEAYHRDRNEPWEDVQPKTYASWAEAMKYESQEYNYLFRDGEWRVLMGSQDQSLAETLAQE